MSKYKLLLADDSITIQKVVNLTFADEGVEVVSVSDGNAALDKFAEFTPDLVMVDINMPGLSGYEICERIKGNEATRQIPVILLVGSFEPFDEEEAKRVGADDFLTKPFQSIRQLVTKVSGLLESTVRTAPAAFADPNMEDAEPAESELPAEFHDTLKMSKEETAPEQFSDEGFDDEMIQTQQVGGFEPDEAPQVQSLSERYEDAGKTQPLTSDELAGITDYQSSEPAESESSPESGIFEEQSSAQTERGYAFVGETPFSEFAENPAAETEMMPDVPVFDTEPLPTTESFYQQPQAGMPTSFETDAAIELDEGNLLELPPRNVSSLAASTAETQPLWQEDVIRVEEAEKNIAAETFAEGQVEDSNIEEAAETDAGMVEADQTAAVETQEAENSFEESEAFAPVEAQAAESPVEEVEADVKTAEVSELSPSIIEAIAAKVSERFSDRIIREIVAEITPQITELIAKRISDENSKE